MAAVGHTQDFVSVNNSFLEAFQAGRYKEALPLGLRMLSLATTEFGNVNVNYAISADNVAETHAALENWAASIRYWQEAKRAYIAATQTDQIVEAGLSNNSIGNAFLSLQQYDSSQLYFLTAYEYFLQYPQDQYPNLLVVAGNLIEVDFLMNDLQEVIVVAEALLPVIVQIEGDQSDAYYTFLEHAGNGYRRSQLYAKALDSYAKALVLAKKQEKYQNKGYPSLLEMLADCYRNLGQFKVAESLLEEASSIYKKTGQQDPFLLGNFHHNFGNLYGDMGDFSLADSHYDTALHLLEKGGYEDDLLYATILKSRAYTDMDAGKQLAAVQLLEQVARFYQQKFGWDHPELAEIHASLANNAFFLNQPAAAKSHIDSSRLILSTKGMQESYLFARLYELEGMIANSLGNSNEGIGLCKKALALNNKIFGDSSRYTGSVLSNMGIIYQETGNYMMAEEVLRQSFTIVNRLLGIRHPQTALSMANLAMVLVAQARYADADKLLAASLEIMLGNGMLAASNTQTIINNIALMAQRQGDYSSAETLYLKVLENMDEPSRKRSNVYETVLANLSTLYLEKKDFTKGLDYALQTQAYAQKRYGKNNLLYLKSSNNVLAGYTKIEAFEKGRLQGKELLPLVKTTMGDSSELLAVTLRNLGMLEQLSGNISGAINYFLHSLDIQIHYYKVNLYALSEKDQVGWWQQNAPYFQMLPAFYVQSDNRNPAILEKIINQQLQLKGFVLKNASATLKRIRNIPDPFVQKLADQWQFTRSLYLKQLAITRSERTFDLDSLQVMANNYEQAIYKKAGNQLGSEEKPLDWKAIQRALKPGETALEYLRFPELKANRYTGVVQYGAIIIRAKGAPEIVPLGIEKDIQWCLSGGKTDSRETAVSKLYRTQIGGFKKAAFTGDSLYRLIWEPLQPYLKDSKVIYLAPDGLLHKVAFAALPVGRDSVLLDQVELRQVASLRQVAAIRKEQSPISEVLLAGHANFNGDGKGVTGEYWSDLPGTQKEIDVIQAFFTGKAKKVVKWQGMQASESQLKTMTANTPDIIHIATHGFFLPDVEHQKDVLEAGSTTSFLSAMDDPLLRSGIILANANKYWRGDQQVKDAEDGILTAYELAQLDWQKTQLVVLSACETGLGELQDSEGVFGLQRALKLAGVQRMILSLWQVPDAETAELMTLFYQGVLQGKDFRAAFYEAQKNMRARYKPFAWAAFVLVE